MHLLQLVACSALCGCVQCHGSGWHKTLLVCCLQVASRSHVVLFDLITLCQQQPEVLDACLAPLLSSSHALKLGFEVSGDISKLAGSWPAVSCFRQVVDVLDLRPIWVAYGLAAKNQVCREREPLIEHTVVGKLGAG